jgi:integrase/recombinase XerD
METPLPKVSYEISLHNNKAVLLIKFSFHADLVKRVKLLEGAKWSQTKRAWYVPDNEFYRKLFKLPLQKSEVKEEIVAKEIKGKDAWAQINPINSKVFEAYRNKIIQKGYSPSTLRTYSNEFAQFLYKLDAYPVQKITLADLDRYIVSCLKEEKLSENTVHSRINALKFYFEQILGWEKYSYELDRPKKHLILPKVISEEKIIMMFAEQKNFKHKAILMVAYSAGLRVGEVVELKINDIDIDRKTIFVRCGKGKRDRVVPLSRVLEFVLAEYLLLFSPSDWLFEGQDKSEHYHVRSAQIIFKESAASLGLPSSMSFHTLRHTFATHLLEYGIDISKIQKILGHQDLKTTLLYLHIAQEDITKIESPLDKIMSKRGKFK